MKPLVSILIPAYNAQEWIADTIKSALAQSWPNKEIIIVDDGSKDRTLSVARQFASKTVSVLTQPHQGASATRNKAFAICQGEYIQWLDADDLLSTGKIFSQMKIVEQCSDKHMLLSCGWGHFYYRTNKAKFAPTALWEELSPLEWILRKFEGNLHMQTATWLVSRELTEETGPWNPLLFVDDDGEYFCRAIMRSHGIRFVPDAKVFYRLTDSNRLSYIGHNNQKMDALIRAMRLQISYLRTMKDDERVRTACITYLQNWLSNFYPNRPDLVKEVQELVQLLGGHLKTPTLPWKYVWMQKTFGWRTTKAVKISYNLWKNTLLQKCDKIIFHLEKGRALRDGFAAGSLRQDN